MFLQASRVLDTPALLRCRASEMPQDASSFGRQLCAACRPALLGIVCEEVAGRRRGGRTRSCRCNSSYGAYKSHSCENISAASKRLGGLILGFSIGSGSSVRWCLFSEIFFGRWDLEKSLTLPESAYLPCA